MGECKLRKQEIVVIVISFLGASLLLIVSVQTSATIFYITMPNIDFSLGKNSDLQCLEWLSLNETLNIPLASIESGYKN